jgi:hypothetical protein
MELKMMIKKKKSKKQNWNPRRKGNGGAFHQKSISLAIKLKRTHVVGNKTNIQNKRDQSSRVRENNTAKCKKKVEKNLKND